MTINAAALFAPTFVNLADWSRSAMNEVVTADRSAGNRGNVIGRWNTFAAVGAESQVWGQQIPVTWGKVKLRGPIIQMGAVRSRVIPVGRTWSWPGANGGVASAGLISTTLYTTSFVVALGYPGDPNANKIINRVWVNGSLVYQEGSPSAVRQWFGFYRASETAGVADSLKEDSADPLTYRGLQYLVLIDWPIGGAGMNPLTELPVVEVELFDYAITTTPAATLTAINAALPGPGVTNANTFYDFDTGTMFTVDSNDLIHKWSLSSGREIDQYAITGKPAPWGGVGQGAQASTTFVKVNGRRFITAEQNVASNVNHFVVIDLDTGVVTGSFGLTNTGASFFENNIATDRINNQLNHFGIVAGRIGAQRAYVVMPTLGNGEFLFRITDSGTAQPLAADNAFPRPTKVSREGVIDANGTALFIMNREPSSGGTQTTEILAIDIGGGVSVRAAPFASSGLPLVACFSTLDDHFVLFESDGSTRQIRKVNPITGAVAATIASAPNIPTSPSLLWDQSNTAGRSIGWISTAAATFYVLDMLTMQIVSWPLTGSPSISGHPAYDVLDNRFYDATASGVRSINVSPADTARISLSSVLTGICVRAGYALSDVIVENITDQVTGAILPANFNLRDTLSDLARIYGFKFFERDGKLVITRRLRGASFAGASFTIFEQDRCVLAQEGEAYISIRTRRVVDNNVPSKISLTYIDEAYNYQPSTYTYQRPAGTTTSEASANYSIPIVMQQSEAAALVSRLTYDTWSSRLEHEFRLPQKYLALEPGDTINLWRDGFLDLVEVQEVTVNGDFTLDVIATSITTTDAPAFAGNEMTNPLVTPPVLYGDGRAEVTWIDTPTLEIGDVADDTSTSVYLAITNAGRGAFPGATAYWAPGPTADFQNLGAAGTENVTGRLTAALPDTAFFGIERAAIGNITIRLLTGDASRLSSVTTEQMLLGANRVLIGDAGRWEVIGYETVTTNPDGTVTLSGTLRGMRGTDINAGNHTAADKVIFVDRVDALPVRIATDTSLNGVIVKAKAGYDENALRATPAKGFVMNTNGRKPFAPVQPKATLSVSDVVLTWNRRSRSEESLLDSTGSQRLDETAETYDLEILNGGGTVVRTVTGLTSATYTYTAANQTADGFTAPVATIRVRIYQVSSVVGRGFARSATLDVQ